MQIYNSQRHIYCSIRSLNWTKHHFSSISPLSYVVQTIATLHHIHSYTFFVNIAVELKCSTSLHGTMKCKFNSFHSINVSTFSIDFVLSKNRQKSVQLLKKPSGNYPKSVSNTWKCGFFFGYGYSWCKWEHLQNGKKIHMKWISIKMACISREEYITVVLSWFHPGDELIMKFSDVIEINMNNNWCMNTRNLLKKKPRLRKMNTDTVAYTVVSIE